MKNQDILGSLIVAISVCFMAEATEISQAGSGGFIDDPVLNRTQGNVPDESILWQLFHAKKYKQLTIRIDQLKNQFPGWQPPTDLVIAVRGLQRSNARAVHSSQRPSTAINKNYSSRQKTMGVHNACANLQARWNWAENYLKRNQPAKALDIYKHIIVQCPARSKMETLEKVRAELEYSEYKELLELGKNYLPAAYLNRLKYDALKDRYVSDKQLNPKENERTVKEVSYLLELLKDGDFAEAIGWRYFNLKEYATARDWFQKAVTWNPANENALYGQSLSLEKTGEYDKALAAYSASKKSSSQMQAVAKRILKTKAWQDFDNKNLTQAAENAAAAEKINGTDQEIQELNAWIAKENGQNDKSAKLFDELYLQSPSRKYAKAYVESQARVDRSELDRKAEQQNGVLLDEYRQYFGKELYYPKQFQSAYKLAPNIFPKLENIDSPSIDMGGYLRYKSGEDGLGRLDLFKAPVVAGSYSVNGNHTFKLGLSRVQLYSGSPARCVSPIGSLASDGPAKDACAANPDTPFAPTRQLDNALEIDFSYRKDGWFSPFAKIGSTPIGGVIDPTVTFDIGFVQQAGFGNWGLEAYSQPVRQSILSYTGIRDPYSGQGLEWGRVSRTGIRPSMFYRFNDNWNASGAVDLALLEGKNVKQNTTVSASAAFSRNLHIAGFDYFNVGPSVNYEHFDKNLSHFTYGHGGYFSPEHYFNIGAGINFLTEEGKPYVIKGRLVAGFQDIEESSVAYFPLGDHAAGSYSSAHQSGEALDFELKGVWLINSNFQLGAGGAIRKTNGFEDYAGGLFLRYFFDNRKASFSTDIPDNMFSSMY